jgi:ABC-type nitrate/sulfonate/bicarbonate transport system permease component
MSRVSAFARKWGPPAVLLALLIGAWEAVARLGWVEDYLLPAPSEVARALVEDRDVLMPDMWVTAQEVLLGFALALAAGLAVAVVLHLSPLLRRALYPLVVASQAVPVVVIAPILVIWFGFGMGPKLIVIALICFFPIVVNTLDGLRSVDGDQARMLRTLGAGRWATFRRLELPTALPYLFSGAKVAVAVAVIGAVFGELVGSDAGLGHVIQVGMAQLLTARVFAAVFLLSVMAIALFALVAVAERRLLPWAHTGRRAA